MKCLVFPARGFSANFYKKLVGPKLDPSLTHSRSFSAMSGVGYSASGSPFVPGTPDMDVFDDNVSGSDDAVSSDDSKPYPSSQRSCSRNLLPSLHSTLIARSPPSDRRARKDRQSLESSSFEGSSSSGGDAEETNSPCYSGSREKHNQGIYI